MNIKTILWPTDFSDDSRHAFDHAVAIAKWYSARIVALHARSHAMAMVGTGPAWPGDDAAGDEEEHLRNEIARAAALGVDVTSALTKTPAAAAIVGYAWNHPIDLIVIGTHGASGFEHLILGSVTEKVLRKASRPVLTVPPRARATSVLPFKRIVCPVDFSSSSLAALRAALSFAHQGGAELTLMHVLEEPDEDELFVARSYDVHRHRALREQEIMTYLTSLVPDAVRALRPPNFRLARGKPYPEILNVAEAENADLIVMGVQGR